MQPQPRQHPDIRMLQQQIMFKQMQEMQRKQQLHEYSDARQQNYMRQLSSLNNQAYGGQVSSVIKGTPINDASQIVMAGNMDLVQHGASPILQGFSQGLVFPQAQNHDMSSAGLVPEQLSVSLYGNPIATGNNLNQYSHIQGASNNFGNMLTRGNNSQLELPIMQSSNFSNSFVSEQCNPSFVQGCMPSGIFVPQQVFPKKNLFGQVNPQGSQGEILPGNVLQMNTLQSNGAMQDYGRRQVQAGWPGRARGITPESGPPWGTDSLDPLEEKILFNTDGNGREASLAGQNHMGSRGFDSKRVDTDYSSLFPSIQSGSWSALMQSAVAEASSSDTGAQEEWSGLSFQNPELSTDDQPSTYIDRGKQQSNWVDSNLQNVGSPSSKPQLQFHNLPTNSWFPGFQQSDDQSLNLREGVCSDSSHESVQQSPHNANKWSDCNPHQKHSIQKLHLVQVPSPLQNNWPIRYPEPSGSDAQHHSISSYTNITRDWNNQTGYKMRGQVRLPGSAPWPVVAGSNEPFNQPSQGLSGNEQDYAEQIKFVNDGSDIGNSSQKGLLLDIRSNSKAIEEKPHQSNVVSRSALVETSAGFNIPCATAYSGEGMLDLLNKGDNSLEHGSGMHSSCGDAIPFGEVPRRETFDASLAHSYHNISASQGYGLLFGPPAQKIPNLYSSLSLVESSSATFPSGTNYLNNQLQNQHLLIAPGPAQSPQAKVPDRASKFPASRPTTSRDASNLICVNPPHDRELPILETMPVTHPSVAKGVSQQMQTPNLWSAATMQPRLPHSEPHNAPSNFLSSPDSENSSLLNPAAGISQYNDNRSSISEGNDLHKNGACSGKSQDFDCREELSRKESSCNPNSSEISNLVSQDRLSAPGQDITKHFLHANAATSSSVMTSMHHHPFSKAQQTDNQTQSVSNDDLEAFGRSLRPSHGLLQNYSLLHQVHSLKNVETNTSYGASEKDNNHKLATGTSENSDLALLSKLNSSSSGDNNKLLSCSSDARGNQSSKTFLHTFLLGTQQMVLSGQTDNESHSTRSSVASNTSEQAQITVQKDTSWFKRYETLRNGQILPMYGARAVRDAGQQFSVGKPFQNSQMSTSIFQVNSADASQGSSIYATTGNTSIADKQLSTLHVLPQNLAVLRPKKRKIAALDLLPWHKEVIQGSQGLQSISTAESKWALSANRVREKLVDETEVIVDVIPIPGAKRRLILTTQLMQQVFRPVPAFILSADANSNCESVAYFAARLALGDACGLSNDSGVPFDSSNMLTEKLKIPESPHEQNFSITLENVVSRAKRLEDDLIRMERRTSFSDIRVESQELEKFSIMNRLAKFYSRGHTAATDTLSSSCTSQAIPKLFPQRYVIALPMPRTVPEETNCLSL